VEPLVDGDLQTCIARQPPQRRRLLAERHAALAEPRRDGVLLTGEDGGKGVAEPGGIF